MDIKVSVIVAVYNSEKYLRATLDSIINQTLSDIEIICVDDGSTDNSVEILNDYAKRDNRIIVMHQREPSDGAAAARNLGILHASGEYLSILDADDFFEPDMLEKAYDKAINTGAEIAIYDGYVFDDCLNVDKEIGYILHTELLPNREMVSASEHPNDLFQFTIGSAWNCLFKKSLISDNKIEFKRYHHADDLGFVYLAFACANSIAIIRDRLIHYRLNNSNSQAATACRWPEASYRALEDLKQELIRVGKYEQFKNTFVQCAIRYINFYLEKMNDFNSLVSYYDVIKNDYSKRLDILEVNERYFFDPICSKLRYCIQNMSAGEYYFCRVNNLYPFDDASSWKEKIKGCTGLVLYGAGNIGRKAFLEICGFENVRIIGWTDKNYKQIGYPVVSPDVVMDNSCTMILVAVAEKTIFESIKSELKNKGIREDIIIWIGE